MFLAMDEVTGGAQQEQSQSGFRTYVHLTIRAAKLLAIRKVERKAQFDLVAAAFPDQSASHRSRNPGANHRENV